MAGLPENPVWEDEIYQWETTDPVVGGPPNLDLGQGVDNVPTLQLANRTAYLRDLIAPIAAVTGVVIQPGAAVWSADGHIMQNGGAAAVTLTGTTRADMITDGLRDWGPAGDVDADFLGGQPANAYVLADAFEDLDVLNKIKTVDGAGSGLDADTLDGQHAAVFALRAEAITAAGVAAVMAGIGVDDIGSIVFAGSTRADLATNNIMPGDLVPGGELVLGAAGRLPSHNGAWLHDVTTSLTGIWQARGRLHTRAAGGDGTGTAFMKVSN